mmetsp:Transcript_11606/g.14046  ORF Transcript_11606/g.14046 Transcript_11606/m.14046 type:complete len:278 (+) Transcript_11606:170-1003(+)
MFRFSGIDIFCTRRASYPHSKYKYVARKFSATKGTSVNPLELAKFQNVDWSLKSKENNSVQALFEMHELRMRLMRDFMWRKWSIDNNDQPLAGKRILDIGCGGGLVAESLAKLGASVVAIDAAVENVQASKERIDSKYLRQIRFVHGLVEDLAKKEEAFDLVCCLEVVEHVLNPPSFLNVCSSLVAPNGSLIVSTMNRTVESYALAIVAAEHIFQKVPVGTHDWTKFVKPEEIQDSIHSAGLHTEKIVGMMYNPITRSWNVHPFNNVSVNYMLMASK